MTAPVTRIARAAGFSLVELMVAMALGLVLVGGALAVHVQSNDAFHVTEKVSMLQENGRFALDTIIPEMRLAGYWADTEDPASIARRTGDATNPMPAAVTPDDDCYAGAYLNVLVRLEAANDDQIGANNPFLGCVSEDMRLAGTDIAIVRHVATTPTAPGAIVAGQLYIISSVATGEIFVGGQPIPTGYAAGDQIHALVTNVYYVSPNSSAGAGTPSLRRLVLRPGPEWVDEELIPGVEDFQLQLGIDTDNDLAVNSYHDPGAAPVAANPIVAARLWVRVRDENPENGFTDEATYDYGTINVTPDDAFRRVLISRTIQLRNGRSL